MRTYFGRLPEPDHDEQRRLWRDRLEVLWRRLWRQTARDVQEQKPGAIRAGVAGADRAARLYGLDEPAEQRRGEGEEARSAASGDAHTGSRDRLVVVDAAGEPIRPDRYSDLFEMHAKAADLPPLRLHDLRHTALSLLLAEGVPVQVVAKIAGHDPSVTLRTYAHAQDSAVQDAVERLGAFYGTR